jgi:hypothetical protein
MNRRPFCYVKKEDSNKIVLKDNSGEINMHTKEITLGLMVESITS